MCARPSSVSTEPAGGYDGASSFRSMAREDDLTDQQFEELCQQFGPTRPHRGTERAAPVAQPRTILAISFENGFPEFSNGNYNIAADDAYPDDSYIPVDDTYPDVNIRARPACGVAMERLVKVVAGEATREEVCAVCMETFSEGQKLRIACPSLHRFHKSCIFRWLTVNRVCPVCRFELPPAKEETGEDSHTDTVTEETVTAIDAETDEDESDETDREVSDIASETDSSTDRETDAYTTEETDMESDAETESTETDTVSGGETEGDTTEETDAESDEDTESDSGSDWW